MDINNLTLEQWLLNAAPREEFPGYGKDYPTMYSNMATYLNTHAHSATNIGALLSDGELLTDHGPEHIKTVIQRATQLVTAKQCTLTAYEVFILLAAIHFHDVGNMLGRKGHEVNSQQIMRELGPETFTDHVERVVVYKIAQAHGGTPKDKLESLPPIEPVLGKKVRLQFLAAILKFADELADDSTRASTLPWHKIPKKNQIYHRFANSLKTVDVDHKGREVKLHFFLNEEDATQKFGKGNHSTGAIEEIYLLDEILERVYKTHLERVYCMRFMNPCIRLDSVSVKIDFYEDVEEIHEPIGFRLEERGYPDGPPGGIFGICKDLKCNGETVKNDIMSRISRHE